MYLHPPKRRQSNFWRVLSLLLIVVIAMYGLSRIQREGIESPFVPTATPTRSAFSYASEAQGAYMQGDLEGAIADYERALQLDPDDIELYVPLIRLLVLEGRVAEAIELGEQAVALQPESAQAWAILGMAYDWNGQVPEAVDACLRAIELDPAYAEGYAYLAEAYADATRWDEALEAAQTALTLAPRSVDAQRNYGYVLEVMGNWSGAVEAYRQALEIHPNLAHIHMDLGRNYQALADTPNAIEAFRRAAELDPDRAEARDQLGWTYFAIQEYDRAQTFLQQAIEIDPEYAPAYGHLATTFWVRRNYEDAIPNYAKTIDLAFRTARRNATAFYVTVELAEDDDPYPSPDVVLSGELEWVGQDQVTLSATLAPQETNERWADSSGQLTMDVMTGEYTLMLEEIPSLPAEQIYVGWFDDLHALDGLPLSTGALPIERDGSLDLQLTALPVLGPRIEHFYTLGLCYFYMDQCDRAYPLFDAALQMNPAEVNALEGIILCQEAESMPTP